MMNKHIFLVGYRGAGKSTIGRRLGAALGMEVVDTDQMICGRSGMSVPEIVDREGWEGFRRREAQVLAEAAEGAPKVVATGGGAVVHTEVWKSMHQRLLVVWLYADIATLAARISPGDGGPVDRPSLTGAHIADEIEDVLCQRSPLYGELADLRVDTGRATIESVVQEIVEAYRRHGVGSEQ